MSKFLRIPGAIAAATLLVAGCAARPPLAPLEGGTTQVIRHAGTGHITVPLVMPALGDERGVQYAYGNSYINTVEVRLRDSLGHQSVQYVVRNAYLAGSKAGGTVPVTFYNVLPGVFTLTVRTSHERLLSDAGPVKYDGLRDVYFLDGDGDDAFDPSETEIKVLSGSKAANFLVFAPDDLDSDDVVPWSLRSDASTTPAGFGLGAATQSINPGSTTTVTVNVRQAPRWADSLWSTTREVTAGEVVSLPVGDTASIQANDQISLSDPAGFALAKGIADVGSASLHVYAQTQAVDTVAATVSFRPTRATVGAVDAAPSPWRLWFARGQAFSEVGYAALYANAPRITVYPALVATTSSRIFAASQHVARNATAPISYDLRDAYGNLVAGNVTGVNEQSLGSLKKANAGVEMDYALVSSQYSPDPLTGLNPFILPGVTAGDVSASGVYTQGSAVPGPVTTSATYSVGGSSTDLRLSRLEVPQWLYKANTGVFTSWPHTYTLDVQSDPDDVSRLWVSLSIGGVTIASQSIDPTVVANTKSVTLLQPTLPTGVLPVPMAVGSPVTLIVPDRQLSTGDNGSTFTLSSAAKYGNRRVSEPDTVRARVTRDKQTTLWTSNVLFYWAK